MEARAFSPAEIKMHDAIKNRFWLRCCLALAMAGSTLLMGCAVPFPVYAPSTKNVLALRSAPKSVQLGSFSGDQRSVSCRLQPITPDGNRSFAQYIRDALSDELVIANPPASLKPVQLSIALTSIEVYCGILSASWTIELQVSVDGRAAYAVKTVREFDGNYMAGVVLPRAYQAFIPAVQDAIAAVLAHTEVQAAMR